MKHLVKKATKGGRERDWMENWCKYENQGEENMETKKKEDKKEQVWWANEKLTTKTQLQMRERTGREEKTNENKNIKDRET